MVKQENLPTYYKKVKPYYHRFFKEIFTEGKSFEELEKNVNEKTVFGNSDFFDRIYLYEAITLLRRSIFNLLAYKHLVCGKHLPMSKVSLYYSYFDAISCLLRIRGVAIVHVVEVTNNFEDIPKNTRFTVTQHENHTYSLNRATKNEHRLVWSLFHDFFPNLSAKQDGRWFSQDRYEWNYGLLYPSQTTEEFTKREIRDRCENNFLDPQFQNASSPEEAEHKQDLIGNYGYEEIHAGNLIKECIKLLVSIAKDSEHKGDYVELFNKIKNDIEFLDSQKTTKIEIKKWIEESITEINSN